MTAFLDVSNDDVAKEHERPVLLPSVQGVQMKKGGPTAAFWKGLVMLNVLAMIYPVSLFLRAESDDDRLLATFVLIGSVFLLLIADAVSILVAYS